MAVLEAVNDDDDVFAGYGESKLPEAVAAPVPAAPAVVEPTLPAKPTDPAPHVDPNVNVAALPVVPHEVLSDPSATSALQIDELTWWTTDKDIADISALVTGDSQCIVDMTFNEHKTNGKSRGSVYVQFTSSDAAARTKYQFESIEIDGRMPTVRFADPAVNPFRVLPKESIHASNGVTGGNHVMGGAGRGGGMRSGPGFQQQQQQQGPYQQQQQGYGVGAGYMGGYAQPPPHQMHYPGGPPPPGAMYGQYNGGGGPQYGAYRPPPHYQQQQQQYGAAPVGGYGNQGMGRPAYGPTSGIPARPTYGPGGGTPASLS
ncbi:hypothetical protein BC828DRAFT_372439 [Blastocladiella britannica]|nr:hypothetical protein BC828DRAFT_372439 [Blastocladiella britannica]